MSLALVEESAKEVRRLAIAGSQLAVGDFRLKKLIPPLEQAGSKVPVFGQVAKAIGDVVNGKEADAAANLLNLSTLLNAILFTQGQTGADGDYGEIEVLATRCTSTKTPARVLKPLVQALTSSGGGRFELIKDACERGAFNDLRLIQPAIQALGDNYPEIADFVAEKILPGFGAGIVPHLKTTLDLKGKKQDARKLAVMHQLDPAGTIELCKAALENGSAEVKAVAIACLGKHEDCLPLVLEQANSKNKQLRAAALEALAGHDRPEIVKLFTDLIKGKALDLLAGPFRAIRSRQVLQALLDEGKQNFGLLLKSQSEPIPRFSEVLNCLEQRKEAEVEDFLLTCFESGEKLTKLKPARDSVITGPDLLAQMAAILSRVGSPKALDTVLAKQKLLPPVAFDHVLRAAVRAWPSARIYDEFSPLLGQNKGAGKEKNLALQRLILAAFSDDADRIGLADTDGFPALRNIEWDPRWLDAAIKADEIHLVYLLSRPGHKGVIAYLVKAAQAKSQFYMGWIFQALARCGYPKLTDLFIELVTKRTRNPGAFQHETQMLLECARFLPAADLPKLDAFAAKLDEKYVDKYLEALAPLRAQAKPAA